MIILTIFVLLPFCKATTIVHEGGSCGTNSIPYKIVVDTEGKPEISCQAPSCVGVDYSPQDYKQKDVDMSVTCDVFKEVVCGESNQWTGGLVEINNGTHRTLKTECCSFEGMTNARAVKSIFLGPLDSYEGGNVEKNGEMTAFDVIKEVRKTVSADNQVQYIVAVYRLQCVDSESNEDDLPVLSRNRRRLQGSDMGMHRRNMNARRRALLQRLEDYYDYDYDLPIVRRAMKKSRAPLGGDQLWPVQYSRAKAYGDGTYQGNSIGDGPIPPPSPSYNDIQSQNIAPISSSDSYNSVAQQPVGPPVDGYAKPNSYAAYPSYPSSYNGYPVAPQPAYSGYPSYPAYQPAYQPAAYQPAYQPAAYQPAQPNLNSFFSGGGGGAGGAPFQCFSGDMEVETENGVKLIKDLVIGDKVLSIEESFVGYSPIVMFLHKRDQEEAIFNQIETVTGEMIKLTDNHLIYVSDCNTNSNLKLVASKDVKLDDCIHITTTRNVVIKRKVNKMTKVAGTGIYSPLTSNGDIIVNRVLASCHSNLALKSLQQTFFAVYRKASSVIENLKMFNFFSNDGDLPLGIESLTTVMDLFIPQSFV